MSECLQIVMFLLLFLSVSPCLCVCLCHSLSLPPSLFLSLSLALSISHSLSLSISLSIFFGLSLFISPLIVSLNLLSTPDLSPHPSSSLSMHHSPLHSILNQCYRTFCLHSFSLSLPLLLPLTPLPLSPFLLSISPISPTLFPPFCPSFFFLFLRLFPPLSLFFFLSLSPSLHSPSLCLPFVTKTQESLLLPSISSSSVSFNISLFSRSHSVSLTLSVSLTVCLSVCLSLYVCLLLSVPLSFSLSPSICLFVSLCLRLSRSHCLYVCMSLSLSLCLCLSASISAPPPPFMGTFVKRTLEPPRSSLSPMPTQRVNIDRDLNTC